MSSGIAYPPPTYIPPLPVFNPLFFPQSFGTTTTSGGGGGQTNIFPNGLTSGNVITLDGGTGGGGGTGVERTITGISYLDFVDSGETDPTNITGYITLNGNTLEIGSNTALSGINVNLLGSTVSANGVAIATGGNVSNDINNTFQSPATTQTFDTQSVVIDNSALSFPNGGRIVMGNGTSILDFPNLLPSTSTSSSGLAIGWNQQLASNGEVDMIAYGQGGQGGFAFYAMTNTTTPTLITQLYPNGISFFKNIISNNTFTGTNDFTGTFTVDNALTNIGQYSPTNTGLGLNVYTSSPTGADNTAIGNNVLSILTTGSNNTGVGSVAGVNLTTGLNNTFVGTATLLGLTTGNQNTAIGYGTLSSITIDSNNTGLGHETGYNLVGNGSNSSNNTFLGFRAGFNQLTGNNNVSIGYNSGVDITTQNLSNTIAIGKEITSVATGDMIFGFNQYFNNYDYWAKFTPNTTSGTGITLQGTYNNSSNITISSPSINITNILTTPNNSTVNATNLTNGQGTFYVSSQLPYFAYNNAGTITSQQLSTSSTNILGTYTSSGYSNSSWSFDTIPNTLGNQFSFIIYSNTAKTTTSASYNGGDTLFSNLVSNYILAVGTAILIPYQLSDGFQPTPIIYNTTGYLFTAPTSIGGLSFSSVAINQTSTGTQYAINATSTTENPITNGSTLTLVAYNSYF